MTAAAFDLLMFLTALLAPLFALLIAALWEVYRSIRR